MKKKLIKMLGTRNQQNARNRNKIEEIVDNFENKENINIENILPNKNIPLRSKITQKNTKNDIEINNLDKKAENINSKISYKNNNPNKSKSKNKNSTIPPAYLTTKSNISHSSNLVNPYLYNNNNTDSNINMNVSSKEKNSSVNSKNKMTKKKNISSNQLNYPIISKSFRENNIKTEPNELNRKNSEIDFHNKFDCQMNIERNSNSNMVPFNTNLESINFNSDTIDFKNYSNIANVKYNSEMENENFVNKNNIVKYNSSNFNNIHNNRNSNLSKPKNNYNNINPGKLSRNNSASHNISKPNHNHSPRKLQKSKQMTNVRNDEDKMDIEIPNKKNHFDRENIDPNIPNNLQSKKNNLYQNNNISDSLTSNNIKSITNEQININSSNENFKNDIETLLDEDMEVNIDDISKKELNLNAHVKELISQHNNQQGEESNHNFEHNSIITNNNTQSQYDSSQIQAQNNINIDYYSRFVPILQKYEKSIPLEYIPEIWRSLKSTENCEACMPKFNLLAQQVDINFDMRAILIDWIIDVHKNYRLFPETLYICISIIDRYLTKKQILRTRLQLLGTTALFISSKYEEIIYPCIEEFTKVTDDAYNKEEVLQMENDIFNELEFDITYPSPYRFFEIISLNYNFSEIEFYYGCYLLEYFLISPNSNKYYPSIIALAVVLLILKLKNYENYRDLYNLTDSVENQKLIKECAKEIYEFPFKCRSFNLHSVYNKYSSPQFHKVAINELEYHSNGELDQNNPSSERNPGNINNNNIGN